MTEQPTTEQPQAMVAPWVTCEHAYATHMLGGARIYVRICVLCRHIDFDDLNEQAAEIERVHEAALAAAGRLRLLPEGASDDELIDLGNGDEPPPSAATIASVMAVVDAPYRPGADFAFIDEDPDPHRVMVDVVEDAPDGLTHTYWSTHCRHDRHDDCSATTTSGHMPGTWQRAAIERQPAQCKTCASPCICPCHAPVSINEESTDEA